MRHDCAPCPAGAAAPGTLTITTARSAYEPWFVDDAPENGKGYEGRWPPQSPSPRHRRRPALSHRRL